jgi:hypothetical protein
MMIDMLKNADWQKRMGAFAEKPVHGLKNSVFWDLTPCSLSKATDTSEEHIA